MTNQLKIFDLTTISTDVNWRNISGIQDKNSTLNCHERSKIKDKSDEKNHNVYVQ